MKLKERGRYKGINPDTIVKSDKDGDQNEYTDGFYSSASDAFVPDEAVLRQQQSQMVQNNQTTLDVT